MPEPVRGEVASSHRIADAADDWPVQATDAIVNLVDAVRDQTTGKALLVARGVVYGLLAASMAAVGGVLGLIFLIRGMHELLDWAGLSREVAVWVTYVVLGVLFTTVGLLLWRRRAPRPAP